MKREHIQTDRAPAAIGPYSQAVVAGGLVFCSGQIALKPHGGGEIHGTVEEQTRQVLENLKAVLAAAGCTPDDVVKTTVYLTDMGDFPLMNAVYETYFGTAKPARATVEVTSLPREAYVEIDAIALRPD
jgi:2-iminobutanoate/2-iminopropanoate deaminase